jgi:hypothetical protein
MSYRKIVRISFSFLVFLLCSQFIYGQNKFIISGIVKDKKTGEALIGASVIIKENGTGTTTNNYGFYSVTSTLNNFTIVVSYSGYQLYAKNIQLTNNLQLDVDMYADSFELNEVVVTSKRENNISKPLMGVEKISVKEINQLPVIFGEHDVLKSIQLLPGIKSAGEANSGFYVRGGGADQNLILLDEAPVYNPSHLLGFFSTFNSDAIKDVTLYKGGMPAQYGGRLSSVVDVVMKEGNNKEYNFSGGVGLISSRFTAEGPIEKEKGSFIVSGRRTYADMFTKFSKDTFTNSTSVYFYDLNVKGNYTIGKKDKIYLSGYFGRDVLGFGKTFQSDWGNVTGTLRWNHIINSKIFSNTSLIFSDYSYKIKFVAGDNYFQITSQIKDVNVKQDFDWFINNKNKIKFGANIIHHSVAPGKISLESNAQGRSSEIQNRLSYESAIYVSDEWNVNKKINMVYGLRISNLSNIGPGNYYTYDNNGNTIDTIRYNSGQVIASYWNIEPRLAFSYKLNDVSSFKASYNRTVQNLHLLTNSTTSNPTDMWLPSSNNIQPEIADQASIGYFKNLKNNKYELNIETYYKWLQNQIDYKAGADLTANDNIESELVYGKGRAYGIEFLVRKKYGRLTGWIGYTLSRTEKKFTQINGGSWFPAKQDETHNISIVGIYKLNSKWSLSGNWVYNTGNAVSFPTGKYYVNNQTVFLYTERNAYRMPAYHRLDVAATWESSKNKNRKYQSSWTFSLYNVYGRQNAYSIQFIVDPNNSNKTIAQQISLFRFVPGITWNFKF